MNWTPEREEQAKELWLDGKSALTIARVLGDVSRSAVCAKLNRMGLKRSPGERSKRTTKSKSNISLKVIDTDTAEDSSTGAKSFETKLPETDDPRAFKGCRYPIGDWNDDDFRFCQSQQMAGSSYCERHHNKCWLRPPEMKNRKKRRQVA